MAKRRNLDQFIAIQKPGEDDTRQDTMMNNEANSTRISETMSPGITARKQSTQLNFKDLKGKLSQMSGTDK